MKYSTRALLQHWTESSIIPSSRERSVWRNNKPKRGPFPSWKTDRLPDLRVLPGHWSQRFCRESCRPIHYWSSKWYSGIRFEVGRNFFFKINDQDSTWRHLGRIVQIKNTRVWETQDRIWNCMTWRFTRRKVDLIITDWKQWWKEVSSRIYEMRHLAPETEIMRDTPWSRIRDQNSVDKAFLEIFGNGSPTGSALKETMAVSFTMSINVQKWHSRIRLRTLSCSRMKEKRREPEVPEDRSPSGRMSRWPCKDYLKGTCTNSFCEKWHPPECLFYKSKSGCRFGEKCSYAHRQVDEPPCERSQKNDDKSAVAMHVEVVWPAWQNMATCCEPWQKSG